MTNEIEVQDKRDKVWMPLIFTVRSSGDAILFQRTSEHNLRAHTKLDSCGNHDRLVLINTVEIDLYEEIWWKFMHLWHKEQT